MRLILFVLFFPFFLHAQERLGADNLGPLLAAEAMPNIAGGEDGHALVNGSSRSNSSELVRGIKYDYFRLTLPNSTSQLVGEPVDSGVLRLGPSLAPASDSTDFGFIYRGYIKVPENGTYTFYLTSDDGTDLVIDDQEVVDHDGNHGAYERSGSIDLEAGLHSVTIRYFQGRGGSVFEYAWQGPGFAKQAIPSEVWFAENTQPVLDDDPTVTSSKPVMMPVLDLLFNDGGGSTSDANAHERPGPNNTGPLVPESELALYTGPYRITTPGTIIEGVVIDREINIDADNVTIRNFVIRTDDKDPDGHYGIDVIGGEGHLFEDGFISGPRSSGIKAYTSFTARRLEIAHMGGDAIKAGSNFLIENNWMHSLGYGFEAHADGVQVSGSGGPGVIQGNGIIRHNFFDMLHGVLVPVPVPDRETEYANSQPIILKADFGPIDNVLIEGNWFDGGIFQVVLSDNDKEGSLNFGFPSNITITENIFGLIGHPHATQGPISADKRLENVDDPSDFEVVNDPFGDGFEVVNNQFNVDLSL